MLERPLLNQMACLQIVCTKALHASIRTKLSGITSTYGVSCSTAQHRSHDPWVQHGCGWTGRPHTRCALNFGHYFMWLRSLSSHVNRLKRSTCRCPCDADSQTMIVHNKLSNGVCQSLVHDHHLMQVAKAYIGFCGHRM